VPVRPHGNKGYEARVQYGLRRFSKTFRSKRDAHEWEARIRSRINDSELGRPPRYTLPEALARWLNSEARALKSYSNLLEKVRVMYPHVHARSLAEIGEAAEAIKSAGIRDGLKPATINRRLAILRRVARLAFRAWNWTATDLSARISMMPGESERHVYLTRAQAKRLLAAASGKTREAIRWTLLTGLRRGELLSINPQSFRDGAIVLTTTKSGRPRIVPLPSSLNPKRFPHGLTRDTLRNGFEAARDRAGLPGIRFHDLRHTYASWLAQGGVHPVALRDLLGHSSLAVTSRYAHLGRRDLWETVQHLSIKTSSKRAKRSRTR